MLSDRDRALLDAIEPVAQRQPADWAEANRRLERLLERFPADAQLWYLLASGKANFDDFDAAVRSLERAVKLDPGFARAHGSMARFEPYLNHFTEAHQAVERCVEAAPGPIACLDVLTDIQAFEGDCEGMVRTARQMIAAAEPNAAGFEALAAALAALGRPAATIRETLHSYEERLRGIPSMPASRVDAAVTDKLMRLAMLFGDFRNAESHARRLEQLAAPSPVQDEHGKAARALAEIYWENGRDAEAAGVAMDFLDRRDAWEPNPGVEDIAMGLDATPPLLLIAVGGRRLGLEQFQARREEWRRSWTTRVTPNARPYLWLYGHAGMVVDSTDARMAVESLARHEPLPWFRPETLIDASVGRTFALAGREDEALEWLEHATRSCYALSFPMEHTRAHLWLGQTYEKNGDKRGACAAYRVVVDRWGQAKPKSVTAEEARERFQALGCGFG
jgi:serine/threonine-protein kinase